MSEIKVEKLESKYAEECAKIESELLGETSKEKILATLESDVLHYYVLVSGQKVLGFFECQIISPEAELYDIAIKKDYQGKGYSKILMEYFIDLCKNQNCDTIYLEVNSINNKAINLYKKYGFSEYSIRKNYYGKNDAILMKLSLI